MSQQPTLTHLKSHPESNMKQPDVDEFGFTPRQREVLCLFTSGENIKSIAEKLEISSKTVEYHWDKARKVIGIFNPVEAVHWALAAGLIENRYNLSLGAI
jgi:DNA-binding NarL/FixJ family response regulator